MSVLKGDQTTFKVRATNFMFAYMYELEVVLMDIRQRLQVIDFQSDEANMDRPLKEFLKKFIMEEFNRLPEKDMCMIIEDSTKIEVDYTHFSDMYISNVKLPEELDSKEKDAIRQNKKSVYTNPDLYLEITNGIDIVYESIELKSTKADSIPGSSIRQVNPFEWTVFVKHTEGDIKVLTGQYINSINSKLQFPDRSPRPQVSFKELFKWNKENRFIDGSKLKYILMPDGEKADFLMDWQAFLANRWVEILFSPKTKKNEPWFNNNLRIFALEFLKRYDELSEADKHSFKQMISGLIDTKN